MLIRVEIFVVCFIVVERGMGRGMFREQGGWKKGGGPARCSVATSLALGGCLGTKWTQASSFIHKVQVRARRLDQDVSLVCLVRVLLVESLVAWGDEIIPLQFGAFFLIVWRNERVVRPRC